MSKFFTKRGWLTFYAMSCGYIHQTKHSNGFEVILSMNNAELNTFDIKIHGWHDTTEDYPHWQVVEGLPAARKLYKEICGKAARRNRKVYEPATMPKRVYA